MCFVWTSEQTAIISLYSIETSQFQCMMNCSINLLKPNTYITYHHTEILCSAHNAFMCFAWMSEQTAIISLYSIDLSVFITEAESVYCAVRAGSSYLKG